MNIRSWLNRNKVLLLHVSFWLVYYSYRVYDLTGYLGYKNAMAYTLVPMAFDILASYVHYFIILPPWLRKKKPGNYFLWLVLLLVPVIALRIFVESHTLVYISRVADYYRMVSLLRVISTLWDTLSFIIFTGMIRFVLDWFDLETKKNKLENEKLIAELNYLKLQINPHFLFNTLHNLNYLVYSGSKNATEVIIKLSNIMRYMIYDVVKDRVQLKQEITYMHDYIHLESIRLNNAFRMNFKTEGPVSGVEIAPLVLITFLENAFKHGVSDQEQDCWIDVELEVNDERLRYYVRNRKVRTGNRKLKSGFGLDNLKKRLQLSYPGKHELAIEENDDTFEINLVLHYK
jgi:sensor histidine kinase YesM